MNSLCIVPCGKKKIWDSNRDAGPTQARHVYTGPFAKKCREYAERFHSDSWCILSAKYGFLWPDDIVPGAYNISFNDRNTTPISLQELSEQAVYKGMDSYEEIVVLGGKHYVSCARAVFPGHLVRIPLSNCRGIGYMMRRLNVALQTGIPL